MTTQESFKQRVRFRMAHTGERYLEARRVLLHNARPIAGARRWVALPELSDQTIRRGTGRGWDEWCDLIEAFPGRHDGHAAIASHLSGEHGLDAWWSQGVTVGYERIAGLRLPHQMPDGTFTANKSRTVVADIEVLRAGLLDDEQRLDLFPGLATELRSRSTARTVRLAIGVTVAAITLDSRGDGRVKIVVEYRRLPSLDAVEEWTFYWSEWFDAIDDSTRPGR